MPTTIILSNIENYEEGFGGRAQIRGYSAAKKVRQPKGIKPKSPPQTSPLTHADDQQSTA
jgi:hypothetical protein